MIEVENLSKVYGTTKAVDGITFSVKKGEILGFLGPNGAGKTTTMRILTSFLPATSGKARVAGYDVAEESLQVRRRIGYLPEQPPLYDWMTVSAYLNFVGRIKGTPSSELAARVDRAMEATNITDKRRELVKRLSRGYKQRVGLAQAVVHDPEVIILDEPTVGLDPKQIIEVRNLIKGLAGEHTILLSTHILPEVSMTCDRVVIINKGKIVAVDTPQNLTSQLQGGQRIRIEMRATEAQLRDALAGLGSVRNMQVEAIAQTGRLEVTLETARGKDIRSEVAARVVGKGLELFELRTAGLSLEEIFLELTTKEEAGAPAAQGD